MSKARGKKVELSAKVVSSHKDGTVSVEISRSIKHTKYDKYLKRTSVFKAHDSKGLSKEGELVVLRQSRPLSKTKKWLVVGKVQPVGV